MSQLFTSGGQSIAASASVLPVNIQDWFPLGLTDYLLAVQGTLKSLLQHHSSKASILRRSAFFIVQLSHPYMTPGKIIALTRQAFVGKEMSLLFNMLSRLVIAFLPRRKHFLNFMVAVIICIDFGVQENKVCHCFHCFPICLPWSDAMILVFWMLSFRPAFSFNSFTFKRLFCSSLLSAIRVVSSACLMLIFLLAILLPACASSSQAFHMMYSACKLNKQGDNMQPWCTPFPIWNQSIVPYTVLTVASWPAYRFLRRQLRASLIAQLVKNLPAVQETPVQFLLEKGSATHSSILGLLLWFS